MLTAPSTYCSRVRFFVIAALLLVLSAVIPCSASVDPLPEEESAAVLSLLRNGAGNITSLHADFIQEKSIPDIEAMLYANGRVSLRAPNALRWELLWPAKAGYVLNGNTSASWTHGGGQLQKTPLRENPRADEVARFVVSCLAFNEQTLRKRCVLDVIGADPPTVRLVPKNDLLRVHLTEAVLTFSPDGQLPHSIRILTARGEDSLFTFGGVVVDDALLRNHDSLEHVLEDRPVVPPGEHKGAGAVFSAMLTEQTRRLPLLLYVWSEDAPGVNNGEKVLRCVAFTEVLLRIGSLAVTPKEVAVTPAASDGAAARVLETLGIGLRALASGLLSAEAGAMRHKGQGWTLDLVPAGMK